MRSSGQSVKDMYVYDIDHEVRRKEQLERLFARTKDQVEEEEMLLQELKKIDTRKKERERKAQVNGILVLSKIKVSMISKLIVKLFAYFPYAVTKYCFLGFEEINCSSRFWC